MRMVMPMVVVVMIVVITVLVLPVIDGMAAMFLGHPLPFEVRLLASKVTRPSLMRICCNNWYRSSRDAIAHP